MRNFEGPSGRSQAKPHEVEVAADVIELGQGSEDVEVELSATKLKPGWDLYGREHSVRGFHTLALV